MILGIDISCACEGRIVNVTQQSEPPRSILNRSMCGSEPQTLQTPQTNMSLEALHDCGPGPSNVDEISAVWDVCFVELLCFVGVNIGGAPADNHLHKRRTRCDIILAETEGGLQHWRGARANNHFKKRQHVSI